MSTPSLLDISTCATPQDEYWYHVVPQSEMPLAGGARPARVLGELDALFPDGTSYVEGFFAAELVATTLLGSPELAEQFRLVLSISDKRFYLDLSYLFSRTLIPGQASAETICGCAPNKMKKHSTSALLNMLKRGTQARREAAARTIAEYLVGRGLPVVLDLYFGLDQARRTAVNDLWLAPHDVQQNETKRRGHGAEAYIAQVLNDANIQVAPENKATDPMGAPDPNISTSDFTIAPRTPGSTVSSDIVVLDEAGSLQIMMMALVQSSDPGQFGVDKAATNGAIRASLDDYRTRTGSTLELWGIVDGIGYAENPNGTINRMLTHFDHFVQQRSAYKAILGAGRLGLCTPLAVRYDEDFYSPECRAQMHERYAGDAVLVESDSHIPADAREVKAGCATVWIA